MLRVFISYNDVIMILDLKGYGFHIKVSKTNPVLKSEINAHLTAFSVFGKVQEKTEF